MNQTREEATHTGLSSGKHSTGAASKSIVRRVFLAGLISFGTFVGVAAVMPVPAAEAWCPPLPGESWPDWCPKPKPPKDKPHKPPKPSPAPSTPPAPQPEVGAHPPDDDDSRRRAKQPLPPVAGRPDTESGAIVLPSAAPSPSPAPPAKVEPVSAPPYSESNGVVKTTRIPAPDRPVHTDIGEPMSETRPGPAASPAPAVVAPPAAEPTAQPEAQPAAVPQAATPETQEPAPVVSSASIPARGPAPVGLPKTGSAGLKDEGHVWHGILGVMDWIGRWFGTFPGWWWGA